MIEVNEFDIGDADVDIGSVSTQQPAPIEPGTQSPAAGW
jgi:hypothetical protein